MIFNDSNYLRTSYIYYNGSNLIDMEPKDCYSDQDFPNRFRCLKIKKECKREPLMTWFFPRNNWWITARHTLGWAKETLFLPVRRLVWGRWRITIISGWIGKTNHGENAKSG